MKFGFQGFHNNIGTDYGESGDDVYYQPVLGCPIHESWVSTSRCDVSRVLGFNG